MMGSLRVRISEGSDPQPILLWDSIWQPWKGQAEWALAGIDEPQNRGGLQSKAALHTAIVILLFTDKRISKDHPLFYLVRDSDLRGWFGDGVDIDTGAGEGELGSLLWVFERSPLTEEIRRWVEAIALDALAPLVLQGAVTRIDVQATAEFAVDRCDLFVQLYGRDGSRVYDYRFDAIWQQTTAAPRPKTFAAGPTS